METRLKKVRAEVDRLIRELHPTNERFFYSHLHGVSNYCSLLALRRKLNVEIATITGMLHDIYPLYTGEFKDHAIKGAAYAKQLLETLDIFSDEEIQLITNAVYRHSNKRSIDEPYDELLKDADVMYHCLYDPGDPIREKEVERYYMLLVELGCEISYDSLLEQVK